MEIPFHSIITRHFPNILEWILSNFPKQVLQAFLKKKKFAKHYSLEFKSLKQKSVTYFLMCQIPTNVLPAKV